MEHLGIGRQSVIGKWRVLSRGPGWTARAIVACAAACVATAPSNAVAAEYCKAKPRWTIVGEILTADPVAGDRIRLIVKRPKPCLVDWVEAPAGLVGAECIAGNQLSVFGKITTDNSTVMLADRVSCKAYR